jgi:hypothetical protein
MIYAIALLMICDPSLTALFTPRHSELGRYEVCTTSESIEQALAESKPADQRDAIEPLEALEAFGTAGTYNRAALARLYGGTRVRVARRWQRRDGQFVSETLLSPYPDPTLTRLNPGTMLIRWIATSGPSTLNRTPIIRSPA